MADWRWASKMRWSTYALALALVVMAVVATDTQHLREELEAAATEPVSAGETQRAQAMQPTTTSREVLAMSIAALVIFIAAGGGTGGGGVLDPIYILIMGLDPKIAIPLSSITIVGGSIANFLLNVRKSRRNSNEPVIDWDFILVMQPMLLLGANFGTFINSIVSSWLLCILMVAVLAVTGKRTLEKAISARRLERWGFWGDQQSAPLIGASAGQNRQAYHSSRNAVIPWRKLGSLFGLFGGVVLLSLISGTPRFPSIIGLAPNTFLFSIISLFPVIFLMVFSHYSYKSIVAKFYEQQNPRYILAPDEIQWTPRSVQYFPLIAMGAGAVAGMFGIGGGIINAPLMLELGIEPTAASAMTATTVLFSSSMSSFSYILMDTMDFHFVQFLLPIGFIATFAGHVGLERLVVRFNCPSLIVFSMAIIVIISAIAMTVESILALTG